MACGNTEVSRAGLCSDPAAAPHPAVSRRSATQTVATGGNAGHLQAVAVAEQEVTKAQLTLGTGATARAAVAALKQAERSVAEAVRKGATPAQVRPLRLSLARLEAAAADRERELQEAETLRAAEADRAGNLALAQVLQRRSQSAPQLRLQGGDGPGRRPASLTRLLPVQVPSDIEIRDVVTLTVDDKRRPSDLAANTAYVYGTTVYVTDRDGSAAYAAGVLKYVKDAPRHDDIQADVGKIANAAAGPLAEYVGGHLIAVSLGGFPSGANLFAQNNNFNVSAFASYENIFRAELKVGNRVEIALRLTVDNPGAQVASGAILTYKIKDGDPWKCYLLNEGHQLK